MSFWNRRHRGLDAELQDYLDRQTADNIASGMAPDDARAAAQRKLGSSTLVKEDTRAMWGFLWLERLWQDLHHAARMFVKNPGFTAIAVLSIALGTGANVAMFSGADGLLLRPLPVDRPDELYTLGSRASVDRNSSLRVSFPDFQDLRRRNQSLAKLSAYTELTAGVTQDPGALPKVKIGVLVTGDFFDTLGIPAALGRTFRAEEDSVPGRDAVMVLDHAFWTKDFSSDPAAVGRALWVNGKRFTIIGVAPESFTGLFLSDHPSFYIPVMMWPSLSPHAIVSPLEAREFRGLWAKARLRDGVSLATARADVAAIGNSLEQLYSRSNRGMLVELETELEARLIQMPDNARLSGLAMTLSLAVLFVACANLAGLLASRAPARAREIALRLAMGASRARLIRQIVTENLMIAVCGAALGIALGTLLIQRVQSQYKFPTDLAVGFEFHMDQRAFLFSLTAAVLSVFLFGLMPALQTVRANLATALKTTAGDAPRQRLVGRNLLVIVQVATALILLTMSVVIYKMFREEFGGGPGYRTDRLILATFNPALVDRSAEQTREFYDKLLERVRGVAGVRSASLTTAVPMRIIGGDSVSFVLEGQELTTPRTHIAARVDEDYFETMALPILSGRAFRKTDDPTAPRVAVVNQTFADHYWPGQNPIGKRFRRNTSDGPWVEVVGLTATSKYLWPGEGRLEFVYLPMRQNPAERMTLITHTSGDPAALATPLREIVRTLDSGQPIYDVMPMADFYKARVLSASGLTIQLISGMGVIGMGLSMIGLYGLVAYSVARRTREIGIRLAIGATPRMVIRMVLSQGCRLASAGVALGLFASIWASRGLAAVFPATGKVGAETYLVVAFALAAVVTMSACIPAYRASKVDPNVALRQE